MADYRKHYPEIRATGASVVAVSVDAPEKSETLKRELQLPFTILCDTERRIVQDWDIYNARERGGIAKPAVFVIDRDRMVRYGAVDSVSKRVPASEIVHVLQTDAKDQAARRKIFVPRFADCFHAIRNNFRR